ncbi:MAG: IclR family transcriptional regulator [Herminiimonas sp.]|nr:IclR family transcriptional regulator [Herminiimonas sp.]
MENAISLVQGKVRLSSMANAARLLKIFSDDRAELGISEAARMLNLSKSTVYRIADTLTDSGMLERNPATAKYRLALDVFELGFLVRRKMDLFTAAKPVLINLREKINESVHLAILDFGSIVYISSLQCGDSIQSAPDVGIRKHAFSCAEGKVLLAFQSDEIIERTPKSVASASCDASKTTAAWDQRFSAIRTAGYLIDDVENETGVISIAAPVKDHTGKVIAAACVIGPAQRPGKNALKIFAPDVVRTADAISTRLGYGKNQESR